MLGGTGMLVFVIGLVISTFASLTKATFILGGVHLPWLLVGSALITLSVAAWLRGMINFLGPFGTVLVFMGLGALGISLVWKLDLWSWLIPTIGFG